MEGTRRQQRGAAIVITLLVAGVIAILSIGLMSRVQNSSETVQGTRNNDIAFSTAVAGAERMAAYLSVRDSNGKTTTFSGSPGRLDTVTRIGGATISPPFAIGGQITITGEIGGGQANVDNSYSTTATLLDTLLPRVDNDIVMSRWRVTSTGTAGGKSRTVSMIYRTAIAVVRPSAGLSVGGNLRVAGNTAVLGGGTWHRWTETKAAALSTDTKTFINTTSGLIRKDQVGYQPPGSSCTTTAAMTSGDTSVTVTGVGGFSSGDAFMLMDGDSSKYEALEIDTIAGNTLNFKSACKFNHSSGTPGGELIKKSIPDDTTAINDVEPSVTYSSALGSALPNGTVLFKYMPNASAGGGITLNGSTVDLPDPKIADTDPPMFDEMFGMSQAEFKKLCKVIGNTQANAKSSSDPFTGWTWLDTSKDTGSYANINLSNDVYGSGILIIDAGSKVVTISGGHFEGVIFCVSGDMDFSGGFEVLGAVASMGGTVTTEITGMGNKITYDPSKLPDGSDAVYIKANRTWEWQP